MYYAIDICLIAIIVILTIRGQRKGFVRMILETLGYIASAAAAWFVSNKYASTVYNSYFKEGVIRSIDGRLTDSDSLDEATAAFYSIPNQLRGVAEKLGFNIAEVGKRINGARISGDNVAEAIENTVIGPIVIVVCKVALFVLTMVLASIVLRFLIGVISRLCDLPVLKTANGLLGAALGLVNGIIAVALLATIIFFISGAIDNQVISDNIDSSLVMKLIRRISFLVINK